MKAGCLPALTTTTFWQELHRALGSDEESGAEGAGEAKVTTDEAGLVVAAVDRTLSRL